jgi:hypothetical protein
VMNLSRFFAATSTDTFVALEYTATDLPPQRLDWRLQLAAKQTRAEREIQADAAPTHALTYFNFLFVKRPQ